LKTEDHNEKIIASAKNSISIELEAIKNLSNQIDGNFVNVVQTILNSKGRLIITGIGKSANVATKIVATLNSTGTPAIFMHASDAIHGDLGIIQKNDIVLMLSKSGNTPEIKVLIPLIKNLGNQIIALTADKYSYLAKHADYLLHTPMEREACPNNLAPTTSTTLQMIVGDILAVALLENRGFSNKDFAKYHPGGILGKKLYLRVSNIISTHEIPSCFSNDIMKNVIIEISKKRLGAAAILGQNKKIVGIITDGDIRRMLEKDMDIHHTTATDIMSESPKIVKETALATDALKIMRENNISQLLVVDNHNNYVGMIHIHDLLNEGLV